MSLAGRQRPLAPGATGRLLVPGSLPDWLLYAGPLRRRMHVQCGGADVIRQVLAAGKANELVISTAPVILGAGKRLFDGFDRDVNLEVVKVYSSPYATHVRYAVAN